GFSGVAGHGLLDRAVVLHPLEPGGLPNTREVHGGGVSDVVGGLVEIDGEDDVAYAIEGIEARVTFRDGLGLVFLFEADDGASLRNYAFELGAQLGLRLVAGAWAENAISEAIETERKVFCEQQRESHGFLELREIGKGGAAVDEQCGVLVGEPAGVAGGAGEAQRVLLDFCLRIDGWRAV